MKKKHNRFLLFLFFVFTQSFAKNCRELLLLQEKDQDTTSQTQHLTNIDYTNLNFTEVEKKGKNSVVYKTEINGEPYYYRPVKKNEAAALNGLAAHELAKALDLPYLAPEAKKIRLIRNGSVEEGVLSKSVKGQMGETVLKKDFKIAETNLDEAQVFTYLTANTDAHLNNFFINEKGQLEFFDFDQSFGQIQNPQIQKHTTLLSDLEADSTENQPLPRDSKQSLLMRSLEQASTIKKKTSPEAFDLEATSTAKKVDRNMPLGLGTHIPAELSLDLHQRLQKLKDVDLQHLSPDGQKLFKERLNDLLQLPISKTIEIFPKLKSKKITDQSPLNRDLSTNTPIQNEFTPKDFIQEWENKMMSRPPIDYHNPRLQENIRLLRWGAENNLLQIKLTGDSSTPHVRVMRLPDPITVYLPPNKPLSTVSHELDHAAEYLRFLKKNIEKKNITDLSLTNLGKHIDQPIFNHEELFGFEKQAERMTRRSNEEKSVQSERYSFVYPRVEAIKLMIRGKKTLSQEESTQLENYFSQIFQLEERYMNYKKSSPIRKVIDEEINKRKSRPELAKSYSDPLHVADFRKRATEVLQIKPEQGKITKEFLINYLKNSEVVPFSDTQYELLLPHAQEAYDSLKWSLLKYE
jgi:hypothetical protein